MKQILRVGLSVCVLLLMKSSVWGMWDDEERRPVEHKCPITHEVMKNPVVAADGQSYEREAITRWLTTSQRSPATNEILPHTNLVDNLFLKRVIDDWKPDPLEKKFVNIMQEALDRRFSKSLTTLSDYDSEIALCSSQDFWKTFETTVCTDNNGIKLLKDTCTHSYTKALANLERENTRNLQDYIQGLNDRKKRKIQDIKERTERRAREVISSLVPSRTQKDDAEDDGFVSFDFGYHPQINQQVCGADSLEKSATDLSEQEIVRVSYADFITRHSHKQMMDWQQRFSGIDALTRRLALLEEKIGEMMTLRQRFSEIDVLTRRLSLLEERIKEKEEISPKTAVIVRPALSEIVIPEIARGWEDIYRRFYHGKLVYRPTVGSDVGKKELPIAALANPLDGVFDLSRCGDTEQSLSIAIGYRKSKQAENAKKVEIWLAPRFLIARNVETTAGHFRGIMREWGNTDVAPVGVFWTHGNWEMSLFDYLTTSFDQLSDNKLYKKCQHHGDRPCYTSRGPCGDYRHRSCSPHYERLETRESLCFTFEL